MYTLDDNIVCFVTMQVRVSDTPSEVVSPKSYYFSADGAILVYDTTDLETLNNLQHWLKMLRWARGKMQPVCALWGNKGSGWNSVEEANVTGFQDRNEEKVRLLAKVDVSNDDGHIMEQFNELLKEIHFTHTKSYPSLRQNTGIDTGSVVHLDDYSNESKTGKSGCSC